MPKSRKSRRDDIQRPLRHHQEYSTYSEIPLPAKDYTFLGMVFITAVILFCLSLVGSVVPAKDTTFLEILLITAILLLCLSSVVLVVQIAIKWYPRMLTTILSIHTTKPKDSPITATDDRVEDVSAIPGSLPPSPRLNSREYSLPASPTLCEKPATPLNDKNKRSLYTEEHTAAANRECAIMQKAVHTLEMAAAFDEDEGATPFEREIPRAIPLPVNAILESRTTCTLPDNFQDPVEEDSKAMLPSNTANEPQNHLARELGDSKAAEDAESEFSCDGTPCSCTVSTQIPSTSAVTNAKSSSNSRLSADASAYVPAQSTRRSEMKPDKASSPVSDVIHQPSLSLPLLSNGSGRPNGTSSSKPRSNAPSNSTTLSKSRSEPAIGDKLLLSGTKAQGSSSSTPGGQSTLFGLVNTPPLAIPGLFMGPPTLRGQPSQVAPSHASMPSQSRTSLAPPHPPYHLMPSQNQSRGAHNTMPMVYPNPMSAVYPHSPGLASNAAKLRASMNTPTGSGRPPKLETIHSRAVLLSGPMSTSPVNPSVGLAEAAKKAERLNAQIAGLQEEALKSSTMVQDLEEKLRKTEADLKKVNLELWRRVTDTEQTKAKEMNTLAVERKASSVALDLMRAERDSVRSENAKAVLAAEMRTKSLADLTKQVDARYMLHNEFKKQADARDALQEAKVLELTGRTAQLTMSQKATEAREATQRAKIQALEEELRSNCKALANALAHADRQAHCQKKDRELHRKEVSAKMEKLREQHERLERQLSDQVRGLNEQLRTSRVEIEGFNQLVSSLKADILEKEESWTEERSELDAALEEQEEQGQHESQETREHLCALKQENEHLKASSSELEKKLLARIEGLEAERADLQSQSAAHIVTEQVLTARQQEHLRKEKEYFLLIARAEKLYKAGSEAMAKQIEELKAERDLLLKREALA